MLQRELTYQLSLKRVAKLSRSAGRKAFRTVWLLTRLLTVLSLLALVLIGVYAAALRDPIKPLGITSGQGLVVVVVTIFIAGFWWLRKLHIAQLKRRAALSDTIEVRLTQDEGGLRFSTDQVETYLKWKGISQVILERDGVVVSHGNLFFLVCACS